ncbi:MAG: hypothetical protein ACYCT6_09390 [bacterium]
MEAKTITLECKTMRESMRDAIASNDLVKVKGLIVAGYNLEEKDEYGETAFFEAAVYGKDLTIAKFLMEHGADTDAKNYLAWDASWQARKNGDYDRSESIDGMIWQYELSKMPKSKQTAIKKRERKEKIKNSIYGIIYILSFPYRKIERLYYNIKYKNRKHMYIPDETFYMPMPGLNKAMKECYRKTRKNGNDNIIIATQNLEDIVNAGKKAKD